MSNFFTPKGFLTTTIGSIALTKFLRSPVLVRGTLGSIAVMATGYTYMKISGSKKGLQFRKKLATTIRDRANSSIKTLDKAAQKLEKAVAAK